MLLTQFGMMGFATLSLFLNSSSRDALMGLQIASRTGTLCTRIR